MDNCKIENIDEYLCDVPVIHEDSVREVLKETPCEEDVKKLTNFFKIFADSTRIKILLALGKKELCVCDLSAILDMSQSAISHQLRTLKKERLVKNRRDGKVVYYSLDDDHITEIIQSGYNHIKE